MANDTDRAGFLQRLKNGFNDLGEVLHGKTPGQDD
jgi:hypothetical protein